MSALPPGGDLNRGEADVRAPAHQAFAIVQDWSDAVCLERMKFPTIANSCSSKYGANRRGAGIRKAR